MPGANASKIPPPPLAFAAMAALILWFCAPTPCETFFWIAGSTMYLWNTVLNLIFLYYFLKYKDQDFAIPTKLCLFFLSMLLAGNEIGAASISGAMVVYYLFHIKELRGNAPWMVIGFFIGTAISLFAPGNFVRLATSPQIAQPGIMGVVKFAILSLLKFRATWLLAIVLFIASVRGKISLKQFAATNQILLYCLMWSIVAFSIIFRPPTRALFFTETIATILLLRTLVALVSSDTKMCAYMTITTAVLLVMFTIDCIFMFPELKKQYDTHTALIQELKANDGDVCMDYVPSYHRMVCAIVFDTWTYDKMCEKYGVSKINKIPKWQCLISSGELFTKQYHVNATTSASEIEIYQYFEKIAIRIPHNSNIKHITINYKQAVYKRIPFIKSSKQCEFVLSAPYISNSEYDIYIMEIGKRVRPAEIESINY